MPSSLCSLDTGYTACSIEACPQNEQIFVCGTYQVLSTDHHSTDIDRGGTCKLYKINKRSENTPQYSMQELDTFDPKAAIPDVKWRKNPPNGTPTLAVADSIGRVSILHMSSVEDKDYSEFDGCNKSVNSFTHPNKPRLTEVQNLDCNSEDFDNTPLCLSLDWSDKISSTNASLVVSLSNGYISTFNSMELQKPTNTWKAHDFEAWIAAWNYHDTSVVYTGGDDCRLKGWDLRTGVDCPIFTNKRFDAGVTTISSNPKQEHMLAVGSYDDKVRVFDSRKFKEPLESIPVGGGVWRTKWNPRNANQILVACMHDGFKIIDCESSKWTIKSRFDEHKSLGYGCDWVVDEDNTELAASCSFYDHTLHLWNPSLQSVTNI